MFEVKKNGDFVIKRSKETQDLFDLNDQVELMVKEGVILAKKVNRLKSKLNYMKGEVWTKVEEIVGELEANYSIEPKECTLEEIIIKKEDGKDMNSLMDLLSRKFGE